MKKLAAFGLFVAWALSAWGQTGGLRVPPGCEAKEGTAREPYTSTKWAQEVIHKRTGIEMVFIPAGSSRAPPAMSSAVCRVMGRPHWGQWGSPARA